VSRLLGNKSLKARIQYLCNKAQEVYTFKEHSGRIYAIAFSPDGRSLATGSLDKTWKIFRATTDKEVNAHDLKLANNLRIFR
jgi:WD40 repeat protein